jgi:uncharacterized membrane protein YgdD (TMEM256/DUF423 family)
MTNGKWPSALVLLAALAGAAGVSEAAYGAHGSPDPLLLTSSQFLLFHAAAVIAIVAFAGSLPFKSRSILFAGTLLLLGTFLFCGDLSARALTGSKLFPFAAPIGGTSMIVAWLGLALAGLWNTLKQA